MQQHYAIWMTMMLRLLQMWWHIHSLSVYYQYLQPNLNPSILLILHYFFLSIKYMFVTIFITRVQNEVIFTNSSSSSNHACKFVVLFLTKNIEVRFNLPIQLKFSFYSFTHSYNPACFPNNTWSMSPLKHSSHWHAKVFNDPTLSVLIMRLSLHAILG